MLRIAAAAAAASVLYYLVQTRMRADPPPPLDDTMIAVVARDKKCVVTRQPTPAPAEGEVLIRVAATAINRLDCNQRAYLRNK